MVSPTPNGLETENFVKVLRDVAMTTVKKEQKVALQDAATKLSEALLALYKKPSPANMIAANGAWARAQFIFNLVDDLPDTDGGARMREAVAA